nr:DNA cytosine methyltransferase [Ferrimicrobium acidiphilum]
MTKRYSNISLFTGAMGLDLGLESAGFETRLAIESDKTVCATIMKNRPNLPLIPEDLTVVPSERILAEARLERSKVDLVSGGLCCQPFSTAGRRQSLSDPRGMLVDQFVRVVDELRPTLFLMENVVGILSAAVKHRPLKMRGKGFPPLSPEEQPGSAIRLILSRFDAIGYNAKPMLLNAADYGTPQTRRRVFLVGSRDGLEVEPPPPTHFRHPGPGQLKWRSLASAFKGLHDPGKEGAKFSKKRARYLDLVPPGGDWRNLPRRLQRGAMGQAIDSWGGRTGFCRRLSTGQPAPTLVSSPTTRASCMCHPAETRPLTIKEYARLQDFPDDWAFVGSMSQRYLQIGNAVPVSLGRAVGESLVKALGRQSSTLKSKVGVAAIAHDGRSPQAT